MDIGWGRAWRLAQDERLVWTGDPLYARQTQQAVKMLQR